MKRKTPKGKRKSKSNATVRLGTGPCGPEDRADGRRLWVDEYIDANEDVHGAIMLEPREQLDNAIMGVSMDNQSFIYSYELLVEEYAKMFKDDEDPELTATEWVDYNVVRGCDYMGERRPIIVRTPIIFD